MFVNKMLCCSKLLKFGSSGPVVEKNVVQQFNVTNGILGQGLIKLMIIVDYIT